MEDLIGDSYKYDTSYHRYAEFFGVDHLTREDINVARKIAFLHDWALRKVGREDIDLIFGEINSLQKKLGVHSIGEELLKHLYRAARFDSANKEGNEQEQAVKARERQLEDQKIALQKAGDNWRKNLDKENKVIEEQNLSVEKRLARDIRKSQKVEPEKVERIKEVVPEHTSEKIKV